MSPEILPGFLSKGGGGLVQDQLVKCFFLSANKVHCRYKMESNLPKGGQNVHAYFFNDNGPGDIDLKNIALCY